MQVNYPCDKCENMSRDKCTNYPTCAAWREWFSQEWRGARRRLIELNEGAISNGNTR